MLFTSESALVAPLLEQLVCIGAPTGREHRRAGFIRDWLTRQGVGDVEMDEVNNVFVRIGPPGAALMLDAHTDTVFPDEILYVDKRPDGRWFCPGIKDNTAACAILMVYAHHLITAPPPIPLLLSFTVGEEGRGDLRGMKAMLESRKDAIAGVIALDLDIEGFCRRCVGSTRFKIHFSAPGGHSWNDFGRTSALHAACRWAANLSNLAEWENGQLTYNVGTMAGGSGVNALAAEAEIQLDLRAVDQGALERVESDVMRSLRELQRQTSQLKVSSESMGRRPAGELAGDHPLVQLVEQTHRRLNLPLREEVLSTNANWPTHLGIPAICTGLARGGDVHTREEFLDPTALPQGLEKLAALVEGAAACWPILIGASPF